MMRLKLYREETSDQGTFGQLIGTGLRLFTGELPDHDNASNISCIPPGVYRCFYSLSPRFGYYTYALDSVPGRTGVRIHSANLMGDSPPWKRQLNGCIALGQKRGTMGGQKCVLVSRPAITELELYAGRQPFELEIVQ